MKRKLNHCVNRKAGFKQGILLKIDRHYRRINMFIYQEDITFLKMRAPKTSSKYMKQRLYKSKG